MLLLCGPLLYHTESLYCTAAGKVVNKLIFGLRDSLNQDAFLECVEGLEKLYEE